LAEYPCFAGALRKSCAKAKEVIWGMRAKADSKRFQITARVF